MKKKGANPVKTAKQAGGRLINTVFLLLPAVLGGAAGAGLGRNSLLAGGALLTFANQKDWPDWVKTAAIGMAVNGVATTQPLATTQAAPAAEVTVDSNGQLQGFMLIPDTFMDRGKQYLGNMMMNTYLDKVPVVNKALGLAGIDAGGLPQVDFAARQSTRVNLPAASQAELNRLIADMESSASLPASTMGNIDAYAIRAYGNGLPPTSMQGIDAMDLQNAGMMSTYMS